MGVPRGAIAAVLLFVAMNVPGCSSRPKHPARPIPYATDWEQLREPFPGNTVDTTGALFLALGAPMPDPTAPGTGRPIIYSLSPRRIKITYHPPTGGGCFIDVTRDFRTSEEERLINVAEVTYPLRDAIWPPDSLMLQPLPSRKHLWTLAPEGEVGVPYALTRDALLHFLHVSQLYGQGKPPDGKPEPMKVCDLTYTARVTHKPPFRRERTHRDTSVVELHLEWSGDGASYRMGRTVMFDHRGGLVAVRGDQQSPPMLVLRKR